MWHHDKLTGSKINHCWPEAFNILDDYQASTDFWKKTTKTQGRPQTWGQFQPRAHARRFIQNTPVVSRNSSTVLISQTLNMTSDNKQMDDQFPVLACVVFSTEKQKSLSWLSRQYRRSYRWTVLFVGKVHNIRLLTLSQWLLWDFWCRIIIVKYVSKLGFRLTFGSNIIIVLIRHTWGGFGQIIIRCQAASSNLKASSVMGCLGRGFVSDGIRQNSMVCY